MQPLSTYHLKQWVAANQRYFDPPLKTNRLVVSEKDFLVMVLRGPNTRLDFHIEPGDEFFYQVEGEIQLHLKPEGKCRQVLTIKEGEMFLCPGGLAHSPRRLENTWGLVIERRRRPGEKDQFAWFCERCDGLVHSRIVDPSDSPAQVSRIYREFNGDQGLRSCRACGYVFPEAPIAERLGFLNVTDSVSGEA
jgi:3-hydroxyanthranilate 3,4-dioxygenase